MYQKLRFSWGHIIAFLALIFLSYLTFMGITYYTNGNMIAGVIGMLIVIALLLMSFIVPQICKGTDEKFSKYIKWERGLLVAAPFAYIVCMLPVFHFWTVHSVNDEFVQSFQTAIGSSRQLFTDYEAYADARLADLDTIVTKQHGNRMEIDAMRIQLKGENFTELNKQATAWLSEASEGASTWNVFLMGNVSHIKEAILQWQSSLETISIKGSSHNIAAKKFDGSKSVEKALASLSNLDSYYTQYKAPGLSGLLTAVICLLMLAFPYILQERANKSPYTLFNRKSFQGMGVAEESSPRRSRASENTSSKAAPAEKKGGYSDFSF